MSDVAIVFAVLGAVVVLFVSHRVPAEIVAVGAAVSLWATGVLELDQALAGFGDATVVYVVALFVVSEGLDSTGVTAMAGRQLSGRAQDSPTRLVALVMVLCAVLTALISQNGAVAALLPVVVMTASRTRIPASQLLVPLAFGSHAGTMLALTGTPVNFIVSEAAEQSGADGFAFFEFALAGLPRLVGTILIVVALGPRLLPRRTPAVLPSDLGNHAQTLAVEHGLDHVVIGQILERGLGVAEVIVPPRSSLVGATVFPGMVTEQGGLVVLAVNRHGEKVGPAGIALAVGDVLLVEGSWDALASGLADSRVIAVDRPERVRRQTTAIGRPAKIAIAIVAAMIVVLISGVMPAAVAALLAAAAMIVTRVVDLDEAYRAIPWGTVVLLAGMIPLSTAMTTSGAAEDIAHWMIEVVGDAGPHVLLVALFVLTAALGQLISNTATALVTAPVAVAAAVELGVSVRPLLMCVAVAATAALLTPVASTVNILVMEPGGYRFSDYWRLGAPLMIWYLVIGVGLVPIVWPF